eukprot:gene11700-15664_t
MQFVGILFLIFLYCGSCKKILVIGGTGRVGSNVVNQLKLNGIDTQILVRSSSIQKAKDNPKLSGITIIEGNVNSVEDIIKASKGCSCIIDVHGVSPPRFSKLKDLFLSPRYDPTHPYNINYVGTKNVLAAMHINKVSKLVRITGSRVGKNAFSPIIVMFNALLSKTVKWHEHSEIAIRKSGVDYTVIRSPGIQDKIVFKNKNKSSKIQNNDNDNQSYHLEVIQGDGDRVPKPPGNRVSVVDLAALCVLASDDKILSKTTIICNTLPGPGSKDWLQIIKNSEIIPDFKPIQKGKHNLALLSYFVGLSVFMNGLYKLLSLIITSLIRFLPIARVYK